MSHASAGVRWSLRHACAALPILAMTLTAPALAAGQHPSGSARPHPAASTHDVAAAGEANARRIEACGERSAALLAALRKDDFQAATAGFDAQMQNLLDAHRLQATWTSVGTQFGKLQSLGPQHSLMYGGDPLVVTVMRFEKGDLAAQVACDAAGRVAGFYLRPAGDPPDPAPASSG